jgi:WD40 repeat protein
VQSVHFSPDGRRLLTTGNDRGQGNQQGQGRIRLWEAATGRELLCLDQHDGEIWTAVFSPDGKMAAAAGGRGVTVFRLPDLDAVDAAE